MNAKSNGTVGVIVVAYFSDLRYVPCFFQHPRPQFRSGRGPLLHVITSLSLRTFPVTL